MLKLKDINIFYKDKKIVNNFSLCVKRGEIIVLMGPNGSGKSTLAHGIMGNPLYTLGGNSRIYIDNRNYTHVSADKKARAGLFLAFQSPIAIPGVSVAKMLREVLPSRMRNAQKFMNDLRKYAKKFKFSEGLLMRGIHDGFSGGEKKKIEMMQALFLAKKYAVFDEIDTGLDVDALSSVAGAINTLKKRNVGCLVITHYNRLVLKLDVDRIVVMQNGSVCASGGPELAKKIEASGYSFIFKNLSFTKGKQL